MRTFLSLRCLEKRPLLDREAEREGEFNINLKNNHLCALPWLTLFKKTYLTCGRCPLFILWDSSSPNIKAPNWIIEREGEGELNINFKNNHLCALHLCLKKRTCGRYTHVLFILRDASSRNKAPGQLDREGERAGRDWMTLWQALAQTWWIA